MVHLYQCGVTRVSSSFARWMRHRLCVYTQNVADSHALEACEKLRVLFYWSLFDSLIKIYFIVVEPNWHTKLLPNSIIFLLVSIFSCGWSPRFVHSADIYSQWHPRPIQLDPTASPESIRHHGIGPLQAQSMCTAILGSTSPADSSMHLMSDGVWYFFITTAHR